MKLNKPKFWDYKKPNFFSFLLLPFTIPIIVNNFLNKFKKKKNLKIQNNLKIKSICIGNIYIGGTGKTPTAIKINQILKQLKYKTLFIKKNHKESFDEQKLLETHGTVYSSNKRIESLVDASRDHDIAIFDDGLQDNSINYDLKFVCFNSKNFIGNGLLIPAGPLREKINSLKKYDAVLLNGDDENLYEVVSKIKKQNIDIKIFKSTYVLLDANKLDKKNRYIAFAGIGIPSNFYESLTTYGINIIKFMDFPDHHLYDDSEIKKIKDIAKNLDAKILTTEKDYLRLKTLNNSLSLEGIDFLKMELKVKDEHELIDFIKTSI